MADLTYIFVVFYVSADMYPVVAYYKFNPNLWTLYSLFLFYFWRCSWNIVFQYLKNRQINKCGDFFGFFVIISSFLYKPDLCLPAHFTCRELLLALIALSDRLTLGMTPLDARSARHRALYLTTRYSQEKNSRASGGIQTHSPIKRATAELRHSLRGHRNQLLSSMQKKKKSWMKCF